MCRCTEAPDRHGLGLPLLGGGSGATEDQCGSPVDRAVRLALKGTEEARLRSSQDALPVHVLADRVHQTPARPGVAVALFVVRVADDDLDLLAGLRLVAE